MSALPFQLGQQQFLDYLRRPEAAAPPPGVNPDGLALYATLFFNSIEESLAACFPVTRALLQAHGWRNLVKEFIAGYSGISPLYRQLPDHFVAWLNDGRPMPNETPFLGELAHYEWMELELAIAASPAPLSGSAGGEILARRLQFAPVCRLLHYRWPVAAVSQDYRPTTPPPEATHLLGYRDSRDRVRFFTLNSASAWLLARLMAGRTGEQALAELAQTTPGMEAQALQAYATALLQELIAQEALLD